jgi:hypothetical protein
MIEPNSGLTTRKMHQRQNGKPWNRPFPVFRSVFGYIGNEDPITAVPIPAIFSEILNILHLTKNKRARNAPLITVTT